MTLIEVLVAMVVLTVGVLGLVPLLQASMSSTQSTSAREQGTNLARELIERARQVPYSSTTATTAAAALAAALPEAPSVTGNTFSVTRRGTTYAVTVTACALDDPADGAGAGDASFCDAPSGAGTPGAGTAKVLGYNVTWSGSPITALCAVVTSNGTIGNLVSTLSGNLLGLAQGGAQVAPCATPGTSVAYDAAPDDLHRVQVSVAWTRVRPGSVRQTTLLAAPR